jgi:hypothetical protein
MTFQHSSAFSIYLNLVTHIINYIEIHIYPMLIASEAKAKDQIDKARLLLIPVNLLFMII